MTIPDDIETRRRKALFRAQRRGFREMDLVFGAFADAHLPRLDAAGLEKFEALLSVPDWEVYGWIVQGEPVPAEFDNDICTLLRAYKP